MSELLFTRAEAWLGGAYELAIELGPPDDPRLRAARAAVWAFPGLEGGYLDLAREPIEQPRVDAEPLSLETRVYGVARIGGNHPAACSTIVVREEGGSDWLYFALPLGSLGFALPVGAFPFEDGGDLSWRVALDEWLRRLAEHVYAAVPFGLGLVGWVDAERDRAADRSSETVPPKRWCGYLVPEGGSLCWHPPNQGAPISIDR